MKRWLAACCRNFGVNLAAGFLLFFFSERLFWTVFKPGDGVGDLVITWLAYSLLACVLLNILKRCAVQDLGRTALCGAIYGWLAEGALVGTLYGTESSAPFPLSIVQTALSWHMLISVVVGWRLLTGSIRAGDARRTALISSAIGLFWGAWAPFQWRETPPVIVPVSSFILHAGVTSGLLALACALLASRAWDEYRPGWFGLIFSLAILGVFFNEQVKALGVRPLIVLPLLAGVTLAIICSTRVESIRGVPEPVPLPKRWLCLGAMALIPFVASATYFFQLKAEVKGVSPALIFNGLAIAGGLFFISAAAISIYRRFTAGSPHVPIARE